MKKLIALTLAVLLVAALFVGCSNNKNAAANPLIGKWVYKYEGIEVMSFTFNADGTGSFSGEPITYKISGNTLVMTIEGETDSCQYSIKGDTLTLTIDGETLELVRASAGKQSGSGLPFGAMEPTATVAFDYAYTEAPVYFTEMP